MRQAVDILLHVHSFRFSLPLSPPSAQISPEAFKQSTYAHFIKHTMMLIVVCHTDGLSRANWSGQFSFCARPWHLSYATAATTNLPTWRLLKVLCVLNTRYETTFLLQFELLIKSSCNYLALRTDLGALPTSILSIPGSEAASSSVTSTLRPNLSPRHPIFGSIKILTLRYVYYIYFKEPELNYSRPSPALPSVPRLPEFRINH